jgi:hypothetical protein
MSLWMSLWDTLRTTLKEVLVADLVCVIYEYEASLRPCGTIVFNRKGPTCAFWTICALDKTRGTYILRGLFCRLRKRNGQLVFRPEKRMNDQRKTIDFDELGGPNANYVVYTADMWYHNCPSI